MRKVTLYIAVSLDGYIADNRGKVDWLNGQDRETENIDTYSAFIQDIDTVVMGWKTYHQVATELSPDEWVYATLTSYIITHRACPSTETLKFVQEDPCEAVRRLPDRTRKRARRTAAGRLALRFLRGEICAPMFAGAPFAAIFPFCRTLLTGRWTPPSRWARPARCPAVPEGRTAPRPGPPAKRGR